MTIKNNIKSRVLAIVISVAMVITLTPAALLMQTDPSCADEQNVIIKWKMQDKIHETSVKYSDEFFNASSYVYNHELARLTLLTECSSWTADTSDWGTQASDDSEVALKRCSLIKDSLDTLGFTENQVFYNYGKSLNQGDDEVAAAIARNPRTNVVAVIVRGGEYGAEWASNFDVGEGENNDNHRGFDRSAQDVYNQVIEYLKGQDKSVKLWITGYSRGSAVANLLTHKINNYADTSSQIDRERIFAYTFATPQGANIKTLTEDKNLFNIVNPGDLVPCVAFSNWSYTQYGITRSFREDPSDEIVNKIRDNYYNMFGSELDVRANLAKKDKIQNLMDLATGLYPTAKQARKIQLALVDLMLIINKKTQQDDGTWMQCTNNEKNNLLNEKYGENVVSASRQKALTFINSSEAGKAMKRSMPASGTDELMKNLPYLFTLADIHGADKEVLAQLIEESHHDNDTAKLLGSLLTGTLDDAKSILIGHSPVTYISWLMLDESEAFEEELSSTDITVKDVSISESSYTYNGKKRTPKVTVTHNGKTLRLLKDYTIIYQLGRKNVGTYKVTVKGRGKYTGKVIRTFDIRPAGTSIRLLTKVKRGFITAWTKQNKRMKLSRINGYELCYCLSSEYPENARTITIDNFRKTTKKITGLESGQKYTVSIRTYMRVNDETYYSDWSKEKEVKAK